MQGKGWLGTLQWCWKWFSSLGTYIDKDRQKPLSGLNNHTEALQMSMRTYTPEFEVEEWNVIYSRLTPNQSLYIITPTILITCSHQIVIYQV